MAQRVPLGLEEVAIAVWECPGDGPEQDKAAWDAGLMSLMLQAAFLFRRQVLVSPPGLGAGATAPSHGSLLLQREAGGAERYRWVRQDLYFC